MGTSNVIAWLMRGQPARAGARERLLVGAALGLLAVHTLLDTVIAPERGTGAGDHLAAMLVPLALVAGIAALYPRLPTGGRAVIAAAIGALALVGAALAIADARSTFDRASDWTGFLLAPVGIALVAFGAMLAWRTRKPGGRRVLRRAALGLGVVAGVYWLLVPIAMGLLATHRPRAEAMPTPSGYRAVSLQTSDGLRLAAWYAPSRNGAAVISFPTRAGKLDHAAMLRDHGYGVLLVDMRGYDGSEGRPNAFGWGATRDIDAAVTWLAHRRDVRDGRIGGIGFSVGGEQMLEAAAANHALRAVVSDGAGERSVRETWLRGARAALALPEAAMQTVAVSALSGTAPPPSLEGVARRISPSAVFFVYAGRGGGGEDLNATFYRAAREPKAIWRVAEATHTGGLAAEPVAYERRVVGFFDRYLTGGSTR
ncbi:MAG TPA: alpha/beta hydrolase [Gaiellaceae bacterium]|nr:alpha/beta hydrolase [Gaiellaceae bacterium]